MLPWGAFVLAAGAAPTWRSVAGLEAFPDTYDPLYFVVRIAAWLLALGLVVQAVLSLLGPTPCAAPWAPIRSPRGKPEP